MAFERGYALVIGTGSYLSVPWANIPIAVADATKVREILCAPSLCGYSSGQVTLLHDDTACKERILDALDHLATQTTAEHTVFLYYCGHGAYGTDGKYYLTTHETEVSAGKIVPSTSISEADLLDKLRKIPAKRLVLLFNACHSGEISPSLDLKGEKPSFGDLNLPTSAADALLSSGEGRIIITASRAEQKSWIGRGKLSLFTQALVDGLSGRREVVSNHGYVSAFALYEHIYFAVKEAASELGHLQEPELTVLKGVGPFPVALYRGATLPGDFDGQATLSTGLALREVTAASSQRLFTNIINTIAQGKRSVAIGGNATGNNIIVGNKNKIGA